MVDPVILSLGGTDGEVRLSPPLFLNNRTNTSPADLSQFTPQGNGVYGLQGGLVDPFHMGEIMEAAGGVVFFGPPKHREDFMGMLRVLGIANTNLDVGDAHNCHYWAFVKDSEQPGEDGYLRQMRVVHRFGLRFLFGAIGDVGYDEFPDQPISLPDFLWAFIQDQVKLYGTGFTNQELAGTFGGDGDFAREALSFGLMIENSYHKVYRIWSRAWLVTK